MPAVQTTYSANIRPGLPGMIVDEVPKTLISRTVEAAGGLAFGIPVMQGTADKAGRAPTTGDTAAKFVGISVRDRSVKAEANQYSQYESARVMTEGAIWVTAAVQVAVGDPVYFVPASGAWTNVATDNVQVAGARFDTSTTGTNQLAQVRLG
ncbi:TPA: hypothetical protein ACKPG1_004887 [Pseudomonas aeruginosa]|nr:DUF2190 family protein [Pseudomonas aeruginosa]HBO6098238.1 DUF2190 family protein [Pseudomonas aeruginosa]HEK1363341.1 DUF2190 family protein [Pseudomonas aeruginosa]